jgi:hypothetical protein
LVDALRDVGADAPCWTWWEDSDAPSTSGAVARHQVQEAALHADDGGNADATVRGSAADLLLALYSRIRLQRLGIDGDRGVIERLLAWAAMSTG